MRMAALLPVFAVLPLAADAKECPPYDGGEPIVAIASDFAGVARRDDAQLDAETASLLDAALDNAQQATQAPAIGAAIISPDGIWQSALGDETFYWASAGKLVTATIIMQLVDEGTLALDHPIASYVEGVPSGESITISMLLAHTSGLRSANEIVREESLGHPTPLSEEIALVASRGALFCPGNNWRYSNTGYALLGAVIERLDGGNLAASIQRRVAEPLGLSTLRVLTAPNETGFVPLAPAEGEPLFHPSRAGAAGAIVASPMDMARFMRAFVGGQLVSVETVARMGERAYPMFDPGTYYGLGLMAYRFAGENGVSRQWIGHSGGVPGGKAVIAFDQANSFVVAVALTGDGSAEATANLLLRTASATQSR